MNSVPKPQPPPQPAPLSEPEELLRAKYILFDYFALQDQRAYYKKKIASNRTAASQVNFIRASFALLTLIVTGVATFIVQTRFVDPTIGSCSSDLTQLTGECLTWRNIVNVLLMLSIVFPALGAFFNMLADLYQWDRTVQIYDEALKSLEVPDALSPDVEMPRDEFRASLLAFSAGTLGIMRDETAQFGQLIRTPADIDEFRARTIEAYKQLEKDKLGQDSPGLTRTDGASGPPAPPNGGP